MMMRRFITTLTFSAFMALNLFSQYYSKVILDSYTNSRLFSNILLNNDKFISSIGGFSSPDVNVEESLITSSYSNGNLLDSLSFKDEWFSVTGDQIKVETNNVYVASKDIEPKDGKFYWHYYQINQGLVPLLKKSYLLPDQVFVNLYGLELVKNDEAIIWGNGFDPSVQNTNDSIKVVWLRIKRDGTLISGPHYWKPSDTKRFGIATDASVNADGNMVFVRKSRASTGIIAYYTAIYEIDENDKVNQKIKFDDEYSLYRDYVRFCITKDSGFVSIKGTKDDMPSFLKYNSKGDKLWECPLPPKFSHHSGWPNMRNIRTYDVTRIREAANGDIIFCGTNTFIDTMYNHVYKRRMLMSDLGGSYFGRISPDGKLKWVHYIVSIKNATDCHYVTPFDINEMPNGDLLLGGAIGTSPDTLDFTYRAWLLRVNDKGCFDDDCSHVDKWWFFPEQFPVGVDELEQANNNLYVFPNPFDSDITINLPLDAIYPLQYQITNLSGQLTMTGTINDLWHNTIETNHLQSGSFIVAIKDKSGKMYYQKVVKK